MSDCICVARGSGPEGCGLCNETGTRRVSPQPSPPIQGAVEREGDDLVGWFTQYIDRYVEETNGADADALIACLDRVRDSYRHAATPDRPDPETEGALQEARQGVFNDLADAVAEIKMTSSKREHFKAVFRAAIGIINARSALQTQEE